MRLALLAGASPQRSSDGPISRLIAGSYLIHIEGLLDSILTLDVNGIRQQLHHECKLNLSKHSDVQVKFGDRGSESFLSVIATRVA